MKNKLLNSMTRKLNKVGFKLKQHSPELLVIAGVGGTIVSAVMACKATTKLNSVLEESKEEVDQIHNYVETEGFSEKYTEEDSKKDLAVVYVKTGARLAKLYGPSVVMGSVSIAAILGGHNILRKRNVALAAAYTTIDKSFKDYRGRVVEHFGKSIDDELRFNIKAKDIEETVTNEEGTESVVKKTVNAVDPNNISDYARIFYEGNIGWDDNPEFTLMFLKRQQSFANEKLQSRGHLYLNEVYEMLGFPKTEAGQVIGWIYDKKHPIGDNFVDFGIYDINDPQKVRFVNGYERAILLDFNVDGYIADKMM